MPTRLSKRMSAAAWRAAHIAQRRATRSPHHPVARVRALAAQFSREIVIRWTGSIRAWVRSLVRLRLRSTWRAALSQHVRVAPVRPLRRVRHVPRLRLVRTPRRHAPPSGSWSPYFGGR